MFSPMKLARWLRRKARQDYLDQFWALQTEKHKAGKYSCQFPTREEYARVARATYPYRREQARLTKAWISREEFFKAMEGKAFRRARKLRLSGKL